MVCLSLFFVRHRVGERVANVVKVFAFRVVTTGTRILVKLWGVCYYPPHLLFGWKYMLHVCAKKFVTLGIHAETDGGVHCN